MLKHDYEPESILVDFENATLKSTKTMFPDAIQLGNFQLYVFFSKTDRCCESRLFFPFWTVCMARNTITNSPKQVHQRRKVLNQREKTYGLGIRTGFKCY